MKNKVFLNISAFIAFVFGALYCFSLVFIPIGIYCFIAGKKFSYKADHLLDNYSVDKKAIKAYSIFVSIACFPFGLLSLIAYFGLYGNNVKVNDFEYQKIETVEACNENNNKEENQETQSVKDEKQEETEKEKLEKFEKLKKFREKNIITEEEFQQAKEQMFGKKN